MKCRFKTDPGPHKQVKKRLGTGVVIKGKKRVTGNIWPNRDNDLRRYAETHPELREFIDKVLK